MILKSRVLALLNPRRRTVRFSTLVALALVPLNLMLASGDARAASVLALSSLPNGVACNLIDQSQGLRTVYVLHTFSSGSTSSRFRVVNGPGSTLTYVSETVEFAAVGNTQSGISMCYGNCFAGDFLIATIQYMSYGTSLPCGQQQIVAHPAAETVEIMNCGSQAERALVQALYVEGPGGACGCPSAHFVTGTAHAFGCDAVPVSSSTWGAIKALYAN